jgi:hypothetical protein
MILHYILIKNISIILYKEYMSINRRRSSVINQIRFFDNQISNFSTT